MTMFSVADDVVLVTGAAGGIGLAIAKGFVRAGARVAMVDKAVAVTEAGSALADEDRVVSIRADLTDPDEISKVISETEAAFGRVDVLVNALGVNVRKPAQEYTLTEWDAIQDVNLKSVFEMIRQATSAMQARGFGRVISLGSIQASICWNGNGQFSLAPYCASKAGVVAITRAFALDLAQYGITVNSICPGFVDTPLVAPVKNDPQLYGDIIARTPIGRFADTNEIVAPVLFLASREASYITGQAIMVDGGWTIQ